MGNVCCKPQKQTKKPSKQFTEVESDRPLDRTQSIFVKSKVENFKRHTKIIEDNPEEEHINGNKGIQLNSMGDSDSESDFEVKVQSAESSSHFDNSRLSASRTSVVSRSRSASHQNFDMIRLMRQDQYKKGKVLFESRIKTIYQCMHTNTGKLLISKTYKVSLYTFLAICNFLVRACDVQSRNAQNYGYFEEFDPRRAKLFKS